MTRTDVFAFVTLICLIHICEQYAILLYCWQTYNCSGAIHASMWICGSFDSPNPPTIFWHASGQPKMVQCNQKYRGSICALPDNQFAVNPSTLSMRRHIAPIIKWEISISIAARVQATDFKKSRDFEHREWNFPQIICEIDPYIRREACPHSVFP